MQTERYLQFFLIQYKKRKKDFIVGENQVIWLLRYALPSLRKIKTESNWPITKTKKRDQTLGQTRAIVWGIQKNEEMPNVPTKKPLNFCNKNISNLNKFLLYIKIKVNNTNLRQPTIFMMRHQKRSRWIILISAS